MWPKKGTSPEQDRWQSHRLASALLRAAIFVVPLAAGFVTGRTVAGALPATETATDIAVWWVAVIASSTISATLTDRLARRLLPLTILLKLTMLFPDRAPPRMRVALRSGNFTELRKRISRAQSGEDTDVGEMSELILSLSTALSQHDRKTRGHSERTRAYTDIIAEEMGLSEEARDKLRWAALLHDVGKLEVPAEILNKDSKLTDEEWHIVKQHPVYGMGLVAPLVPWLGEWALTIEHHHERFDGTGYPHGLTGTDISLGARIVSVGDAYDVMTTGRTYQRAKTPAAARSEIASMSGSQFDPVVVRALMNVSLGRLQWGAGPLAMLAELPFIRGLPQVGRDAATLLTSSAVMATSMAVGVVPPPADFLPANVVDVVAAAGDFALQADETVVVTEPGNSLTDEATASTSPSSTVPDEPPTAESPEGNTQIGPPAPETASPSTTKPPTDTPPTDKPTTATTVPPPTVGAPAAESPRARPDQATTDEDSAVVVDVLSNDDDPDGDIVTSSLAAIAAPANGTATVTAGKIKYQPNANYHGADNIGYRICDTRGACAETTVTIVVSSVNDPPVFGTNSGRVAEDSLLSLPLTVSDPDGDALTCTLAGSPASGAATVPADCSKLVYQPAANFVGNMVIPINLTDGTGTTKATVTVAVTPVNDAPVAANDSASTDWLTNVDVAVLSNDSDVDGDPLTITIVSGPAAGSASVNGSGIRYAPTFGSASTFSIGYRICDPSGACATATVSVSVAGVTIARDDTGRTGRNRETRINVLSNDVAANGRWANSEFKIVTEPSNGRARISGNSRIRYSADRRFSGTDSFVYEVCDTAGSCARATVTVTVG